MSLVPAGLLKPMGVNIGVEVSSMTPMLLCCFFLLTTWSALATSCCCWLLFKQHRGVDKGKQTRREKIPPVHVDAEIRVLNVSTLRRRQPQDAPEQTVPQAPTPSASAPHDFNDPNHAPPTSVATASSASADPASQEQKPKYPPCEQCGSEMLFKRAGRGGCFLGCSKWPECKGTRRPKKPE